MRPKKSREKFAEKCASNFPPKFARPNRRFPPNPLCTLRHVPLYPEPQNSQRSSDPRLRKPSQTRDQCGGSKDLKQHVSGTKKRGFLEGGFCKMYASLGCGARSAKSTAGANILGYSLFPLAVTLDSTENPFAKTPFSWFLNVRKRAEYSKNLSRLFFAFKMIYPSEVIF